MFERAEYDGMVAKTKRDASLTTARHFIEKAHQAEVAADALMGDPHWNVYQQLLAGAVEKLRKTQGQLQDQLSSVAMVSHDDIIRIKLMLAETIGIIAGIETAVSLPKQIRDDYAKAQETVEKLSEKHGDSDAGDE